MFAPLRRDEGAASQPVTMPSKAAEGPALAASSPSGSSPATRLLQHTPRSASLLSRQMALESDSPDSNLPLVACVPEGGPATLPSSVPRR